MLKATKKTDVRKCIRFLIFSSINFLHLETPYFYKLCLYNSIIKPVANIVAIQVFIVIILIFLPFHIYLYLSN